MTWSPPIGAQPEEGGTRFRVWAAQAQRVEVLVYEQGAAAFVHIVTPEPNGYFSGFVADAAAGARYKYRLDGGEPGPDPASRFQPDGVHGASQVVDLAAVRVDR